MKRSSLFENHPGNKILKEDEDLALSFVNFHNTRKILELFH